MPPISVMTTRQHRREDRPIDEEAGNHGPRVAAVHGAGGSQQRARLSAAACPAGCCALAGCAPGRASAWRRLPVWTTMRGRTCWRPPTSDPVVRA